MVMQCGKGVAGTDGGGVDHSAPVSEPLSLYHCALAPNSPRHATAPALGREEMDRADLLSEEAAAGAKYVGGSFRVGSG